MASCDETIAIKNFHENSTIGLSSEPVTPKYCQFIFIVYAANLLWLLNSSMQTLFNFKKGINIFYPYTTLNSV